jgi:hypothetical protein
MWEFFVGRLILEALKGPPPPPSCARVDGRVKATRVYIAIWLIGVTSGLSLLLLLYWKRKARRWDLASGDAFRHEFRLREELRPRGVTANLRISPIVPVSWFVIAPVATTLLLALPTNYPLSDAAIATVALVVVYGTLGGLHLAALHDYKKEALAARAYESTRARTTEEAAERREERRIKRKETWNEVKTKMRAFGTEQGRPTECPACKHQFLYEPHTSGRTLVVCPQCQHSGWLSGAPWAAS